ncbi:tenascin-X-like [Lissotriton helveticus]
MYENVSITNLIPGNLYTIKVSAVVGNGVLGKDSVLSAYTVPNVTNNLCVTNITIDSISLSWLPPTGNKSSYLVQVLGNPESNVTKMYENVSITNLIPGNLYTFKVSAVGGNGVLGKDSVLSQYTVPNVTNNLSLTYITIDSISLSWLPPTGNKSSYLVQVLGNPESNVTTMYENVSITNLIPGNLYTFKVSAVGENGVLGQDSVLSQYTVPNVTNNLSLTYITIDSISLSWLPPTGNKSSYLVQVVGNPESNVTTMYENVSITNLIPGNLYTFKVSAVGGNGVLGQDSVLSQYTVPNVTNNLSLTYITIDSISLSWLPPTGNKSSYLVQVLGNPESNVTTMYENVSITNLIPGNLYTFKVSAVGGNGVLGQDSVLSQYTVPNVTNNLSLTYITIDSISLSWLPPTGNKSSYLVQVLGNPESNVTTMYENVSITNLIPGNLYTFKVSAVGGNGVLGQDSVLSQYTVPNVTNNLSLTYITIDSISLSWLPPTGNKSSYLVQVVGNPESNVTTMYENVSITNLIPGNLYTFKVSAVGGNGVLGQDSVLSQYTVPNVTNNLSLTYITIDSISLSWLPPTGNKSSYLVQVLGNPESNVTTMYENVSITNLIPGNLYTFKVSAVGGNGVLGQDSVLSQYTVPNVTNNLSLTYITIDSISLSWLPPTGNKSSYLVQVVGNPESNVTTMYENVSITNLIPGNLYTFKVSAVGGNGVLGQDSVLSQYTVPNVTNNLSLTYITIDSISLSWLPPTGNKSSYLVQVLGNPESNVTTMYENVSITNLIPGNLYTFKVSAVGGNGVLGQDSVLSQYTVPNVTNNLSLTYITIDSISLSWLPPTGNKSSYLVQVLGNPESNVTTMYENVSITNLIPGNLYTFKVSAVGGNGVLGQDSVLSQYTVPNVTNNLSLTYITIDSISLSWLPPTGNKSSYLVQVVGNPESNVTTMYENVSITNVIPGNLYTFKVSAVGGNGVLGEDSVLSQYTVPNVTNNLSLTYITIDSISLSWLPPTGNKSSYLVQVVGNPESNVTTMYENVSITNVIPGNLYTFKVSAVGGNGVLGEDSVLSQYTVPNVTNNLSLTYITIDSISLSWLPPTGNKSSYLVQVLGNPESNVTTMYENVSITNLIPGNLYTFKVSAVGGNGVLGQDSVLSQYTVPNVTNNLSLTYITIDSISLSWLPPTGNKSSYLVQVVGNPESNVTTMYENVSITNLIPGNLYTFKVSAVGGNGVLGQDSVLSQYTVPNVTNNLSLTYITIDSISLSWLPPTGNKSSYLVQVLGNPESNVTTMYENVSITNLIPGNLYTFKVSAVGGNGVLGQDSVLSQYTVPNVTNNLSLTYITIDSISLSWLPPTGNKSSYLVQVVGNPESNVTTMYENVSITNLIPGNLYTFKVSAVGGNGVLGQDSVLSQYTVPNVTNNLSLTYITIDSISLSWLPPTGNKSSYLVQVLGNPESNVTTMYENVSITNLIPGNLYTFKVSAVGGNGVLGQDSVLSQYTVPNITNNLSLTYITIDSISLRWLPPTGNKSSYLLQVLGNPESNVTTMYENVSITNLIPGNLYTFKVSAVGGNGVLGQDSVLSQYTVPNVTNNLSLTYITIDSISLSWLPPTGNKSSYLVQVLGNPESNVTTMYENMSITNVIPGNLYTFKVSAVGGNGVLGQDSVLSQYTVPNVTNNLSLTYITIDSISLSWLPPTGNKSSYLVQVLESPESNVTTMYENVSITNLIPGNLYTFKVSAVGGNGVLGQDSVLSQYTVPNVTNNLSLTYITIDSISLSWLPPTGNKSSYLVQVLESPESNVTTMYENVSITNLIPGNLYTFKVSAVGGNGVLGQDSVLSQYTVPNVTNNLSLTYITIDSISLSWLPPTGNKSSYLLQVLGNPESNVTTMYENVSITNLIPGNLYTFKVSAVGGNGVLGQDSVLSQYTVPNVTNNLSLTYITIDSISLSWLPPTGNKSSYLLQVLGNPESNVTTMYENVSITNLIPGNLYTFKVSAVGGNGVLGQDSVLSQYTVPNVTNNLSLTYITIDSISLSWLPPTGNKSSYLVQVLGNPESNVTTMYENMSITNLIPGNLYTFKVSAVGGNGVLGQDSVLSQYTVPNVTNNLSLTYITIDSISLSWLPPTGNKSSYLVQVLESPESNVTTMYENVSITNLIPGNLYTFKVSAVGGNGVLGQDSVLSQYTVLAAYIPVTAEDNPTSRSSDIAISSSQNKR